MARWAVTANDGGSGAETGWREGRQNVWWCPETPQERLTGARRSAHLPRQSEAPFEISER